MPAPAHPVPLDPIVARAVAELGDDDREWFEERSAVFEYDGGLPRAEAERRALESTLQRAAQRRRRR